MSVDEIAGRDEARDPSARMLESWQRNAAAWTDAVREKRVKQIQQIQRPFWYS